MPGLAFMIFGPLLAAFAAGVLEDYRAKRILMGVTLFGYAAAWLSLVWGSSPTGQSLTAGGWPRHLGIELVVDAPFLAVTGLFAAILAASWAADQDGLLLKGKRSSLFLAILAGLTVWAANRDIFTTFVAVELTGASAYSLVARPGHLASYRAAFRYLIFGSVGGLIMLLGIGSLYYQSGYLNIVHLGLAGAGGLGLALVAAGLLTKSALVPFHTWLPEAHSHAPATISAILSGALLPMGIFTLARLVQNGISLASGRLDLLLVGIGALTVLTGHAWAGRQTETKRLLAYSSVAHMGYILCGVGCQTPAGLSAALLHLVVHGFSKACAFLSVGQLNLGGPRPTGRPGAGHHQPVAGAAFTYAVANLIGLPLTPGFLTKYLLTRTLVERGWLVPAIVLQVGTVLAFLYYWPLVRYLWSPNKSITSWAFPPGGPWLAAGLALASLWLPRLFSVLIASIP